MAIAAEAACQRQFPSLAWLILEAKYNIYRLHI